MKEITIGSGGKERVEAAAKLLSAVFVDDPVIKYLLCSLSEEKRLAYLPSYFRSLLTAAALNQGTFDDANEWNACAVWLPPGKRVDNPLTWIPAGGLTVLRNCGIQGCKRMLLEFSGKTAAAKSKALKGRKAFYYLFFVGTDIRHRGEGLASALIQKYQAIATKDNLPLWLEATTPASASLYTKLGFDTVEEIVLGKGVAGPDGLKSKGGEGVKIWAMIWTPPSHETP